MCSENRLHKNQDALTKKDSEEDVYSTSYTQILHKTSKILAIMKQYIIKNTRKRLVYESFDSVHYIQYRVEFQHITSIIFTSEIEAAGSK